MIGTEWNAMGIHGKLGVDEAVSNLGRHTAEHFAKTINKLRGNATILFINHYQPTGLSVGEVYRLRRAESVMRMEWSEPGTKSLVGFKCWVIRKACGARLNQ